jgi:hypothetical protein
MSRVIITEEDVDDAVHTLRDRSPLAAKARAERIHAEEILRTIKARLMQKYAARGVTSVGAQEREAYADPEYIAAIDRMRDKVEADELERFQRVNAQTIIEAWRSQEANLRALKSM